jgi:hypothetical protein
MASIKRLTVGQVVYSTGRSGRGCFKEMACWPVRIVSIDLDGGFVTASWNHNPPQRFGERHIKKWRITPLKQKTSGFCSGEKK